jgi:hypothetical protein
LDLRVVLGRRKEGGRVYRRRERRRESRVESYMRGESVASMGRETWRCAKGRRRRQEEGGVGG